MTFIPKGSKPEREFNYCGPSYPEYEKSIAKSIAHLPAEQREFIQDRVYNYANYWHQNQKPREGGSPYISHPVAVAEILSEYKLDFASMAAALLHDVHEDNEDKVSLDDIEDYFGTEVRHIVDGLTKIGKASARQRHEETALSTISEATYCLMGSMTASLGLSLPKELALENSPEQISERTKKAKRDDKAATLTKLIISMSSDMRIIIVKLGDRIHNMRTLDVCRPDKIERIAKETLNFFAPLATRLGIWPIKVELEDLCFSFIDHNEYTTLGLMLEEVRNLRSASIKETMNVLLKSLSSEGIQADISLQRKHRYSIISKMRRQNKTLEQIFDLDPILVVVPDKNTCYQALRVIHHNFGFIQGKFRDYIANPKSNNYQALHTTISGANHQAVEIQICSQEEEAENRLGILNVFVSGRYDDSRPDNNESLFRQFTPWLNSLTHMKEGTQGDQDFIDRLCQEELSAGIICCTPEGQFIELPQGSTPLDFAFKIHTQVGLRCKGALVNDQPVSITDCQLRDNDMVQIITAEKEQPNRSWYNKCRTRLAKSCISKWFLHNESPEPNKSVGYKLVCAEFIRQGAAGAQTNSNIMAHMYRTLGCSSAEELYINIGSYRIPIANFAKVLKDYRENNPQKFEQLSFNSVRSNDVFLSVRLENVNDGKVFLCRQCNPVFGDEIVACQRREREYLLHRSNCPNIAEPIKAEWIAGIDPRLFSLRSKIFICALVRHGLSNDIISVFDNKDVLIYKYEFSNDYARNVTDIIIEVGAGSVEELEKLMGEIKNVDGVVTVERGSSSVR